MKTLNTFSKVILMIGLSLTMMACDKKKDSQPSFARNNRGGVGQGTVLPGGDPRYGQNGGNFGYIYDDSQSDMRNGNLYDFLRLNNAQDKLGYTSGQLGQNTGIVITGDISPDGRSGNLRIMIWDQIADQSSNGLAYQVDLQVVSGQVTSQGANVVLSDDSGTVEFNGNWTQNTWEGEVTYDGGKFLGNFISGLCSPIRCQ